METQKKYLKLEATNPVQKEDGYVEFEYTISGNKRDRQGEILDPKGAKVDNFLKNPVLLWGHNQTMGEEPLPIGSVKEIKIYDDKINCKAIIHNITQLAKEVGELVKKGFLNTMSVGFMPLERDKSDSSIITKWEMLEHSVVPVPAYQDALIYAKKMGYNEILKSMENTEIKGVIPYSVHGDGPKAPEDEEWDAGAEVAKATGDAEKLRKMHAWVDSEAENFDASERQWYKLPHHKGDGSQPVVWRGVTAAMAALMGARGGTNIPEADKKGVYNHLSRHYQDFGKEPPEFKEYTEEELKVIEIGDEQEAKDEEKNINNALDSAIKRIDEILQSRNNRNRLKVEKVQESEREEIIKEINKLTQLADKILGIVNNRIKKIR